MHQKFLQPLILFYNNENHYTQSLSCFIAVVVPSFYTVFSFLNNSPTTILIFHILVRVFLMEASFFWKTCSSSLYWIYDALRVYSTVRKLVEYSNTTIYSPHTNTGIYEYMKCSAKYFMNILCLQLNLMCSCFVYNNKLPLSLSFIVDGYIFDSQGYKASSSLLKLVKEF